MSVAQATSHLQLCNTPPERASLYVSWWAGVSRLPGAAAVRLQRWSHRAVSVVIGCATKRISSERSSKGMIGTATGSHSRPPKPRRTKDCSGDKSPIAPAHKRGADDRGDLSLRLRNSQQSRANRKENTGDVWGRRCDDGLVLSCQTTISSAGLLYQLWHQGQRHTWLVWERKRTGTDARIRQPLPLLPTTQLSVGTKLPSAVQVPRTRPFHQRPNRVGRAATATVKTFEASSRSLVWRVSCVAQQGRGE